LAFVPGTNTLASFPGLPSGIVPITALPLTVLPFEGSTPTVDGSLNLYGSVALSYIRKPFNWTVSYTRRANNSSGTGTTTNLDVARIVAGWDVARRWRLTGRAIWQRQSSASDVTRSFVILMDAGSTVFLNASGFPVSDPALAEYEVRDVAQNGAVRIELDDSSTDITSYTFQLRATHEFSRRLHLQLVGSYWYQTTETDFDDSDRESLRFELGFTWSFDPISL
jgi:hypothetical protein